MFGYEAIPFPSWIWWAGAVVLLFVTAVRLQWQVNQLESPQIAQLKRQPYVTFKEISDAISQTNAAYPKNEVLRQLMEAVWNREFEEWSGHSRLRIEFRDKHGYREHHCIVSGHDILAQGIHSTVAGEHLQQALFRSVMSGPASFSEEFVGTHIETLSIERGDFLRWYRRFTDGRYEH